MDNLSASDVVNFYVKREITLLFKQFLSTLEQIRGDTDNAFYKLSKTLPPEHVAQLIHANPLDDHKYGQFRKAILDKGNDTLRGLEEEFKKYKIEFRS